MVGAHLTGQALNHELTQRVRVAATSCLCVSAQARVEALSRAGNLMPNSASNAHSNTELNKLKRMLLKLIQVRIG